MKLDIKSRAAVKISALSSGKIDKCKYLTGEKILHPQQHRKIEEAKFTYTPLGKALEKQTKTTKKHGEKQVQALESPGKESPLIKIFVSQRMLNSEIMIELENIREQEQKID